MTKGRRVVVRGLGLISCLGSSVSQNWARLSKNEGNLGPLKVEGLIGPCRVGGQVDDTAIEQRWKHLVENHQRSQLPGEIDRRAMSRSSFLGMLAAYEALSQSGWISHLSSTSSQLDKTSCRTGTYFSTGLEGIAQIISTQEGIQRRGYSAVGVHVLPQTLANMPAAHVSRAWALRGPLMACNTACATGLHSVGDAFRMITCGEADMMVAGATEASLHPWVLAAFARIRALSTTGISRPFDSSRDGFVMAEGAGVLVLEALETPSTPTCPEFPPIAEILGFGRSADAYSLVSPDPTGDGAFRSMKAALDDAGVHSLDELEHINCHATSTPLGDVIELAAIARLLVEFCPNSASPKRPIHLNSIKGHLGHCMGASGAVEAVYSALAAQKGLYAGNRNLEKPIGPEEVAAVLTAASTRGQLGTTSPTEAADLLFRSTTFESSVAARPPWVDSGGRRRLVLTNSFGFGGVNGSLVLSNWVQ